MVDGVDESDADSESTDPGSLGRTISDESPAEPDIEDVLDDLETLEELVDSPAERQQVRETMRTARRANTPRVIGRLQDSFDLRDAGEAVVGAFIFGAPMIVEGGTLEIGEAIAGSPAALVSTTAFGLLVVLGILHAARFQEVESDMLYDVIPLRLVGILAIAGCLSVGLMTVWGRVEWSQPSVAAAQCLIAAIVMAVGASLGDVLPE